MFQLSTCIEYYLDFSCCALIFDNFLCGKYVTLPTNPSVLTSSIIPALIWFWKIWSYLTKFHPLLISFLVIAIVSNLKLVSAIFIKFLFYHQPIALQKVWKMLFIWSKKRFSISRYSIFCISVLSSFYLSAIALEDYRR